MSESILRYLPHEMTDVRRNFGLEYALVKEIRLPFPVLLIWRTEPTVMVGRYQSIPAEVNLSFVREHGIDLVRRKSGGGTIYTDPGCWQFSIIQPTEEGLIDFHEFIRPVVRALNHMGAPVDFNGRNDLIIDGKKCSGNAQYRQNGYVVHHGSILFATDLDRLEASICPHVEKLVSKGIASVRDRVTNLKPYLGEMSMLECRERLAAALTGHERQVEQKACLECRPEWMHLASLYGESEFGSEQSLWGLNPPFECSRSLRTAYGRVTVHFSVSNGVIRAAELQGDFFGTLEIGEFQTMLEGVSFNEEAVRTALNRAGFEGKIYRIGTQDIVNALFG